MFASSKVVPCTFGLFCWVASGVSFAKEEPFEMDGKRVAPGQRLDWSLSVPAGESDPATSIPLTVLHGTKKGPVLAVVAGVHGFEFASILAVAELSEMIKPESLRGTIIFVRVAHVSAFLNRSPYVNPYDRKNLNRSFPGDAQGTQTLRVAWALSTGVVAKADFLIDAHSGDGAEWLESFVGVYGGPRASDYPTALAVAEAFGFERVVRYQMKTQAQVDRGRSLNRQGVSAQIPTVLVEIGENGSRNPADVRAIVRGVRRTLSVLGMVEASLPRIKKKPVYFDGTSSVPVEHSGVWYPESTEGRYIKRGEVIGVVRDYHGKVLETVVAPESGYALYGLAGPPVKQGESVLTIARPVPSLAPVEKSARPRKSW